MKVISLIHEQLVINYGVQGINEFHLEPALDAGLKQGGRGKESLSLCV
jgi:hypothetical protein